MGFYVLKFWVTDATTFLPNEYDLSYLKHMRSLVILIIHLFDDEPKNRLNMIIKLKVKHELRITLLVVIMPLKSIHKYKRAKIKALTASLLVFVLHAKQSVTQLTAFFKRKCGRLKNQLLDLNTLQETMYFYSTKNLKTMDYIHRIYEKSSKNASPAGFEPARSKSNSLAGYLVNHSDKATNFERKHAEKFLNVVSLWLKQVLHAE
ncbi:uncharacterized protein EV154DRAFT_547491 [Mucor mucedo]|uniref:uncharacterized protein n=1 Tax=Mucor mucedo TaxID=29922 RepID=UPI00221E7F73|nr:uncharacterized protein EV154DRAFT_547491 [Mucor mucedo]KAI7896499.1 hypothetical protein EV154DRAFT_547491 [Mucor mucedo]